MADYKIVNAEQLDADLSAVADAIRERAGTTEELAFPDGFVSAVNGLANTEDYLADVCNKTTTELVNSKITSLSENFQQGNVNLVKVDLPAVLALGSSVFASCTKLATVNLPMVKTLYAGNFNGCPFTQIIMQSLESIDGWGYNFANCSQLARAHFPKLTKISGDGTFGSCISLTALVLGAGSVCTLASTSVFNGSAIENGTGYIYVPKALLSQYTSASNWSTYASQIRAIEDYPEITGG